MPEYDPVDYPAGEVRPIADHYSGPPASREFETAVLGGGRRRRR